MSRWRLKIRQAAASGPAPAVDVPANLTSATPGVYQVGTLLTATPPTGTPPGVVISAPTWKYEDNTTVPGASGTTYTMQSADIGHSIYNGYTLTANSQSLPTTSPTVGPVVAAPAGPTPIVADQTLVFGRLTLANAGDCPVVNTGSAITQSCAINSGTNANHWTINAATGVFVPSAAGVLAGLSASYTLGCTFGNASGTDTATITITTEASVYSAATAAQLYALCGPSAVITSATMAGKTIKLRPGDYPWTQGNNQGFFNKRAYASQVVLTSHDNTNRARLIGGKSALGNSELRDPKNVKLYRIKIYCPFYPAWLGMPGWTNTTAMSTGSGVDALGNFDGFIVQECELYANWKELVDQFGFSTLYAVPNTLQNRSQDYTWRGVMGLSSNTHNGYQFIDNVVHGCWRGMHLTASAGVSGTPIVLGNEVYDCSVDNIYLSGNFSSATIAWNQIHSPLNLNIDLGHRDAIQFVPGVTVTGCWVFGNRISGVRDDSYRTYPGISTDPQGVFMEDIYPKHYVSCRVFGNLIQTSSGHGVSLYNAIDSFVVANTVIGNPDWILSSQNYPSASIRRQTGATTSTTSMAVGTGVKSITFPTNLASDYFFVGQEVRYFRSTDNTKWMFGTITALNMAAGTMTAQMDLSNGSGTFTNWTVWGYGTGSGDLVADNAAYASGMDDSRWGVIANNSPQMDLTNYATYCDGPDFITPDTIAEVEAAFSAKAGGPLSTAVPKMGSVGVGYVNFVTRVWDIPRLNTVPAFTVVDKTGQTASTLITSDPVQITGIVDSSAAASTQGASIVLTGEGSPQFRVTTNADGSGVITDWTTPDPTTGETGAVIATGKYLWLRLTSGTTGVTRSATVKVAQTSDTWSVTAT